LTVVNGGIRAAVDDISIDEAPAMIILHRGALQRCVGLVLLCRVVRSVDYDDGSGCINFGNTGGVNGGIPADNGD